MNNFARAHDQWLNPLEVPEAVLCDDCGIEMEVKQDLTPGEYFTKCNNKFCPAKFEGIAREMAEMLVGALEEVKSLSRRVKQLKSR